MRRQEDNYNTLGCMLLSSGSGSLAAFAYTVTVYVTSTRQRENIIQTQRPEENHDGSPSVCRANSAAVTAAINQCWQAGHSLPVY